MSHFHYTNGTLHVEALSIQTLAERQATPFYCYSSAAFRQQYQMFADAFDDIPSLVCYAMKANSNQAVLQLLAQQGAGADVVSEGELRRALAAGISPQKIIFSGVGKTVDEIAFALSVGIRCFNVESEPELSRISTVAVRLGKVAPIALRVNPDVDAKTHAKISTGKSENKFGIPLSNALAVYQRAQQLAGIKVCGIDMHIGSQITELSAFDAAFKILTELLVTLKEHGIGITHIDLGGGLGVPYRQQDVSSEQLLGEYATIVKRNIAALPQALACEVIFEPGRFIAANAGVLVTQVNYVKPVENKCFLVVDAAMNDLIRPTLYEAWHDISPVIQAEEGALTQRVDVVGPICESSDYLALDRELTQLQEGDLLVLHSAGAYAAAMSNTYNSRPLIAELLVDGERSHVVREAPSYQQLIDQDSLPDWL